MRAQRLAAVALAITSCTAERGPLPPGPALGDYANAGKPESYNGTTLYAYMDGGADTFLEYGFSSLAVRRYTRGSTQLIAELYTMDDAAAAAGLYSSMRRTGSEAEIAPGCAASFGETEVRVARGGRYLVCRDENPMAKDDGPVRDLCTRLAARIEGECGVGTRFAGLPAEGRLAGSEVALAGPLGLNQRAWLTPLAREGFKRGVLATYTIPGGRAEVLLADYAGAESARQAIEPLTKNPRPGTRALAHGRRLVLVYGEGADPETLAAFASRFTADGR
jgi:Family of unknown function (DUF6599)